MWLIKQVKIRLLFFSTEWVLADNVKGKSPSLAIGNGKVSGNAGCNSYNGELTLVPESGTFR